VHQQLCPEPFVGAIVSEVNGITALINKKAKPDVFHERRHHLIDQLLREDLV
jgi:hypothetical protein